MIRELTIHDLKSLEGHANFPMPDVNNPLCFYQAAVVDDDGNLIGAAFAKITTEVSLIFHKTSKPQRRTKALLEVFEHVEAAHKLSGLDDTHVFLLGEESESFEKALTRLGFVRATGTPMYYKVGSRTWRRVNSKRRHNRLKISRLNPRNKRPQESSEVRAAHSGQVD